MNAHLNHSDMLMKRDAVNLVKSLSFGFFMLLEILQFTKNLKNGEKWTLISQMKLLMFSLSIHV